MLTPDYGIVQQVKDCQAKPWFKWLDELDTQVLYGGAVWGCVVAKRPGYADAGEAMAIMRNRNWLALVARLHELESVIAELHAERVRALTGPGHG